VNRILVFVLENIFRFMEEGASLEKAASDGGTEVALPVFAATVTTSVVFFPMFLLNGVSKYIFADLAYGVVFTIFASYIFSMTLVPLFCAKFIHPKAKDDIKKKPSMFKRGVDIFNLSFATMLERYERLAYRMLRRPGLSAITMLGGTALVIALFAPFLGRAYFHLASRAIGRSFSGLYRAVELRRYAVFAPSFSPASDAQPLNMDSK
jgi:multidrug efflux pump subunit AcrB